MLAQWISRAVFLPLLVFFYTYSPAQNKDTSTTGFDPISLEELVHEGEEKIKGIQSDLQVDRFPQIRSELQELEIQVSTYHLDSSMVLLRASPLWEIDGIQRRWNQLFKKGESIRSRIDKEYLSLQEDLQFIKDFSTQWETYIREEDTNKVAPSVLASGRNLLSRNEQTLQHINDSIGVLNELKGDLAPLMSMLDITFTRIDLVIKEKKENLFSQDSPPLLQIVGKDSTDRAQGWFIFSDLRGTYVANTKLFFEENEAKLILYFLSLFIWIGIFHYFRKWSAGRGKGVIRPYMKSAIVLDHWISLSLLAWIVEFFLVIEGRPFLLNQILILLALIPLAFFGHSAIDRRVKPFFWVLVVLFSLYSISSMVVASSTPPERWIHFSIGLAVSINYYLLLTRMKGSSVVDLWKKLFLFSTRVLPFLILLSLLAVLANILGRMGLGKLLLQAQFVAMFGGLLLLIGDMVLEIFFAIFLRTKLGRSSHILMKYPKRSRKYFNLILRTLFFFYWIRAILINLSLDDWVVDRWKAFIDLGYSFGEVTLKVGHLINFILIVVFFGILAKFLQTFISEELLSRFNLKRGVPLAVGILVRYFLLLLGFLMAMAAMGITMDRLSFILGALGVGIGFGLQNIIGNFISGLILVFERPIHIGDVIVTDQVEGIVTEIGARASKVRSWDGAEIVVPNMVFISSSITNWTLSDSTRRRRLTFYTDPEANPSEVIQMIQEVIRQHPNVKKFPEPMALYKGYRDFYNEFQALFWVETEILKTESEISSGVFEKLKEKGIHQNPKIPFMLKGRSNG